MALPIRTAVATASATDPAPVPRRPAAGQRDRYIAAPQAEQPRGCDLAPDLGWGQPAGPARNMSAATEPRIPDGLWTTLTTLTALAADSPRTATARPDTGERPAPFPCAPWAARPRVRFQACERPDGRLETVSQAPVTSPRADRVEPVMRAFADRLGELAAGFDPPAHHQAPWPVEGDK